MKTRTVKWILSLTLIFGCLGFIASCSDDDDKKKEGDKDELIATIADAQDLLDNTEEGTLEGQYIPGSKAALASQIELAQAVVDDKSASQSAVDNTNVNLTLAIAAYQDSFVKAISPTDLIAQWKFDDGSGTTAKDYSGNDHDGAFEAGHAAAGGGGVPTWVADRRGDANKALHFTKGGHILVPAHADFGPSEITLSVWVNLDSLNTATGIYGDNYILSQNDYHGYKFQTETNKYPFFTANTGVDGPFLDRAATTNIPLETWVHLAVTFKTNAMKFYINGVDVTKPVPGDGAVVGGFGAFPRYDFVIGQAMPNEEVPTDINWVLAHFEGSMDELKLYNKALDAGQITSIYNQEKP